MERVDQQQPGSVSGAPAGQLGEVGVIAHPPGTTDGVDLRHPAPQPFVRQRQLVGRHDQQHVSDHPRIDDGDQPVVSERKPRWDPYQPLDVIAGLVAIRHRSRGQNRDVVLVP